MGDLKRRTDGYVCGVLKRRFVESPFMRLLDRLGFRNIRIVRYDGDFDTLQGRKSDKLKFSFSDF